VGRPLSAWLGQASVAAVALKLGCDKFPVRRYRRLIDEAAAIVGTAPQAIGVQPALGQLAGQPWIEETLADHTVRDSLASLDRLPQDALDFLSSTSDSEIKHLQRGCLTIERDAADPTST
jgi:hypothetical protein